MYNPESCKDILWLLNLIWSCHGGIEIVGAHGNWRGTWHLVVSDTVCHARVRSSSLAFINAHNAGLILLKPWEERFFQLKTISNVLVSSFQFIWILMSWVYYHSKYFSFFSAGIVFIRQNLTSTDVRFWRIKTLCVRIWRLQASDSDV